MSATDQDVNSIGRLACTLSSQATSIAFLSLSENATRASATIRRAACSVNSASCRKGSSTSMARQLN